MLGALNWVIAGWTLISKIEAMGGKEKRGSSNTSGQHEDGRISHCRSTFFVSSVLITVCLELVIPGFRVLRQAGAPVAGSNLRQKGPCRAQGGLTSHCATDASHKCVRGMAGMMGMWLEVVVGVWLEM
ncbi:hypothetical protein PoB_000411200 [Plakobranchus ocellatus]|uniref:Uncharacterized protein n=1 Tax=Plakobranchus ocellatus TaxID=259542 RepID=A0AAV3Y592_9GAST|nr:hypothetical protein PoB_000411200 [Plakobranchus ocellatus]